MGSIQAEAEGVVKRVHTQDVFWRQSRKGASTVIRDNKNLGRGKKKARMTLSYGRK